jgi:hypothetical protein
LPDAVLRGAVKEIEDGFDGGLMAPGTRVGWLTWAHAKQWLLTLLSVWIGSSYVPAWVHQEW